MGNVVAHDQSATEITVKYSIFSSNENRAFSMDANTGETKIFNTSGTIITRYIHTSRESQRE